MRKVQSLASGLACNVLLLFAQKKGVEHGIERRYGKEPLCRRKTGWKVRPSGNRLAIIGKADEKITVSEIILY